jgi:sugar phosphate isomerase/epimerase
MKSRGLFFAVVPVLLGLIFLFWTSRSSSINKNQIGLQLYSMRNQLGQDVPGALGKVKAFGFVNVELAGTYGLTPEQFREHLDRQGLSAFSGHFPYDRFKDDVEGVAREAKTLGLKYAGCSWIPHDESVGFTESKCREAAAVLNRAGKALAKYDVKLLIHTHGYEFQPYNGGTLFDLLVNEADPRFVNFQMCVFWVVRAGQDPVKLLEKFGGRWQSMHLKGMRDGTPTGLLTGKPPKTTNVALGTGQIDYVPILTAAKKADVKWYIIEDESPSSEEQLPKSLNYLETLHLPQ